MPKLLFDAMGKLSLFACTDLSPELPLETVAITITVIAWTIVSAIFKICQTVRIVFTTLTTIF